MYNFMFIENRLHRNSLAPVEKGKGNATVALLESWWKNTDIYSVYVQNNSHFQNFDTEKHVN